MKKLFVSLGLLLSGVLAFAQGVDFYENKPWKEILQLSAEKQKLIFLDCYTTWCGPCKAMAKDVFPLPEVGEFMNSRFINVKQDMEKGEGIELGKKYKHLIPGYPTYLLINSEGQVVHQVAGFNAAEKFIAKIKDGLDQKGWLAMSAKYENGERSWLFLQQYFQALEDAFQSQAINKVKAEVLPKLTMEIISADSSAYRIFRKYWTDVNAPLFNNLLASPAVQRKYKDFERDINEWSGRLFRREVDNYTKASLTAAYDTAKANQLTGHIQRSNANGRENMIAVMRMGMAANAGNHKQFISLFDYASQFGMLRYDRIAVSNWAKLLAGKSSDKTLLQQYLRLTTVAEDDRFTSPDQYRNHAFVLTKLGEKVKAAACEKKADQLTKDNQKWFNEMMKKN